MAIEFIRTFVRLVINYTAITYRVIDIQHSIQEKGEQRW